MKNLGYIKQFLAITLLLVFITSCNNNDEVTTPIVKPFEAISDIATFHGNLKSDIVIVNTQGGPFTSLQDDTLKEFIGIAKAQSALVVNVHQEQTKNPDIFKKKDITFEQAKQYDLKSVAHLKRVVEYFKKQKNKKVYVLGISFGAFMTQELIATNGIDIADGYLIAVGRLDIDKDTWMSFSKGEETEYVYNDKNEYTIKLLGKANTAEKRNMARLAAGLGFNRYTERLKHISDLSKITYVFGKRDEAVGKLSANEIKFLKAKGAKGAKVGGLEGGSHSEATGMALGLLKRIFGM